MAWKSKKDINRKESKRKWKAIKLHKDKTFDG